jgi:uncharacterized protein YegP (UPF0339 family)
MVLLGCKAKGAALGEEPGHFDLRSWGDKNGPTTHWVWRLITASGVTIAESVASFDSQEAAEDAISWIRQNASTCQTRVKAPPSYRGNLRAKREHDPVRRADGAYEPG